MNQELSTDVQQWMIDNIPPEIKYMNLRVGLAWNKGAEAMYHFLQSRPKEKGENLSLAERFKLFRSLSDPSPSPRRAAHALPGKDKSRNQDPYHPG